MPDTTESPLADPVQYDPEAGTHRTRYDWESPVSLTTAIVEVVAEVDGVDPRDLDRLTEAVDPEALDAIFAPSPTGGARHQGRVSFVYAGHRVTVHGSGDIEVRPADPA